MILVLFTCPDVTIAERIAESLIEKSLAACAHIGPPGTSIYRWQGVLQKEPEVQVWIKTNKALFGAVEAEILHLHPFEVPQIVSMTITNSHEAYERWVDSCLHLT